ncbi:MAG: aspartate aminotransferase family protein [Anaerolineae bacterium]|nr:aspartate aminotransferase family protein [Anaerolineae bacterium]
MAKEGKELRSKAKDHVVFPVVSPQEVSKMGPLVLTRGEGIYVWDVDGKRYMDSMASGVYAVHVGYGRKDIAKAMEEQASRLHYFCPYGYISEPVIRLGEKLAQLAPGELSITFFTCDGSEAVESAFKIAKQWAYHKGYRRKYKIISRHRAYHGSTMGALAATGIMSPLREIMEPLPPGYRFASAPYCYRCDFGLTYPDCGLLCAKSVEQIILHEGPDNVAAFIGEMVMAAGGCIVPPPEYWPKIREICSKYGVLLIDDEVVCGFGRTGKFFGVEHYGIEPDIMTMAKSLTSGYSPLGATMTRKEIIEDMPAFWHVHTFNNHPVSCTASLENIRIIEEENLVQNSAEVGKYLLHGLQSLSHHPTVGDVRGLGLLTAIEFVRDRATRERFPEDQGFCGRVMDLALEQGLILRQVEDIIEFCPPLIITKPEVDEMIQITDRAITQAEKEFGL